MNKKGDISLIQLMVALVVLLLLLGLYFGFIHPTLFPKAKNSIDSGGGLVREKILTKNFFDGDFLWIKKQNYSGGL
ncbi:MAG: hypothetical protein HYS32_01620 [Candidatus Woesearchaeota archaeon]|nr:MAG: hypothetical protein HYS32_01620 [Candidatus Woesearchaeota archaeon]